jgi:hypothetical protein
MIKRETINISLTLPELVEGALEGSPEGAPEGVSEEQTVELSCVTNLHPESEVALYLH